MSFLLDVNILIALVDTNHVHHDVAIEWFAETGSQHFATCPITQNGLLRILGNQRYFGGFQTPSIVAVSLSSLVTMQGHTFWPDSISILTMPLVDPTKLGTHATITDTYLLALAVHNKGKLATFDRRILTSAVIGGAAHVELIGPISQTQS